MRGTVSEFDEHKGYGIVTTDQERAYFFHCTQIADGSRTIAPGTAVMFELRPWHRGQLEATMVSELYGLRSSD